MPAIAYLGVSTGNFIDIFGLKVFASCHSDSGKCEQVDCRPDIFQDARFSQQQSSAGDVLGSICLMKSSLLYYLRNNDH